MYNPISTYRIQFHKDFNIKMLEKQVPYLSLLGVGTIYASPVFEATPGSAHGYDVVTPLILNPEVTRKDEFITAISLLQKQNIGWLQDIVPNHMAFHSNNTWLWDVLEKGPDSKFLKIFDIEEGVPSIENKLMIPFLGSELQQALENKEVRLGIKNGNFCISYFDNTYPVNFESFTSVLLEAVSKTTAYPHPKALGTFLDHYKTRIQNFADASPNAIFNFWEESRQELEKILKTDKDSGLFFDDLLETYNSNIDLLQSILNKQYYELCHWQETEKRINYRRFFTVNGLICLRMENPEVFQIYHTFIEEMIREGYFNGLRIDHIDGLNNPNSYLRNLRKLSGNNTYIIAEKILEHDEELPHFWPIEGNTGYDFLATANNLLTSVKNYDKLRRLYKEATHVHNTPAELIYQNKKMILTTRMHGEWDNVVNYFNNQGFIDYSKETISREEIKEALGEFMLACPVYRLYPRQFPLRNNNREVVKEIFELAMQRNPALRIALEKLAAILLSEQDDFQEYNQNLEKFFSRLMQFTGPLMAKGVEDTSMYQYNCFIAHNEVGDAINARGITIAQYHKQMQYKQKNWPLTMNNTSTHDTKRGEDVRARLNVISELADEWDENVHLWMQMNQKLKTRLESGLLEPTVSVEYFIYQTLLGTFPFSGKAEDTYLERIDEYLVKALREAKRKVSWRDPDETYENTVCDFARKMLDPQHEFLKAFVPFQQKIAWRGIINSLTQLTLKCTSPGIPDIYQGTELWDLTLVDPDNRQPVDYMLREKLLKQMIVQHKKDPVAMIKELNKNPFDGRIKLWLTFLLLNERKNNAELFLKGDYIPLQVEGRYKENVMAFARKLKNQYFVTIVPLITANLSQSPKGEYLSEIDWHDTKVIMPVDGSSSLSNILTSEKREAQDNIKVSEIFNESAIGLLRNY